MTDAVSWHSRIAADFDARYRHAPAFRERLAVWQALIDAHIQPDVRVLDAGCGGGALSQLVAGRCSSLLGFDASPEMVALANARRQQGQWASHVRFEVGRFGDARIGAPGPYDLILCSSVLEYLDDLWGALDWLAGMMSDRATLIFSLPNGISDYRRAERAVFRVTGRPRYCALIRHWPDPSAVVDGLAARGLTTTALRFYGAPSGPARWLQSVRGERRSEPLFAIACRRACP